MTPALSRCIVRCEPSLSLCSAGPTPHLNPLPPRVRYYIHDQGAFNFSDVLSALHALMAGQPMDLALPVGEAQHLSDIPIMAALERHPLRTWDADVADLHVIGALPYASHVLALVSGELVAHRRRMNALTAALGALSPFISRKKPLLLLHCAFSPQHMGAPLMNALGRGNLIVASCDPFFARDLGKLSQSGVGAPFTHAYATASVALARRPLHARRAVLHDLDATLSGWLRRGRRSRPSPPLAS